MELNFDKLAYEWTPCQEKSFSITVRCWAREGVAGIMEPAAVWNVYANIYDNHPMFSEPERARNLPFHGGCTYDKYVTHEFATPEAERSQWMRTSRALKVGSDYAHYGDDQYESAMPSDGIPWSIRRDVEDLAEALLATAPQEPAAVESGAA